MVLARTDHSGRVDGTGRTRPSRACVRRASAPRPGGWRSAASCGAGGPTARPGGVWVRAASGSISPNRPEAMMRLANLAGKRVGADLLRRAWTAPHDRHRRNLQVVGAHRTERVRRARTRRRGWCPSASTCRCGRCSAGPPGTPRRRARTDGAAVDWSCCAPDGWRESGPGIAGGLAIGPLISFETTFSDLPRQGGAVRRAATGCTQVPPRRIQENWAQPPLAQPGRGTHRRGGPSPRCTPVCRVSALPSTHEVGNSPGTRWMSW